MSRQRKMERAVNRSLDQPIDQSLAAPFVQPAIIAPTVKPDTENARAIEIYLGVAAWGLVFCLTIFLPVFLGVAAIMLLTRRFLTRSH